MHADLRCALRIQQRAIYRDPTMEQLLRDGIHQHRLHPEWCRDGTCRANTEATRIFTAARRKRVPA